MEYWDIYDVNRVKTGKTMVRGSEFADDAYHLVVHVCIFNSNDEMLIQQRQPFKDGWPNMWDLTVGGSAIVGDTSQKAAEREVAEELGLEINLSGIRPHLTVNFDRGFDDIYLIEDDVDITKLQLQPEEVQAVKWAKREEILKMIEKGEFIPYYPDLINLFFRIRKKYGCMSV